MKFTDSLTLILSFAAILVSAAAFFYNNVRRGKLSFWLPSSYALQRSISPQGNLIVGFPVTVTNTGAVVHTVNYMWGILESKLNKAKFDFRMETEADAIPSQEGSVATSFSVSPRSNMVKIIGFYSDLPNLQIKPGDYTFSLYAWIDGRKPNKSILSFNFSLSEEDLKEINEGLNKSIIKSDPTYYRL